MQKVKSAKILDPLPADTTHVLDYFISGPGSVWERDREWESTQRTAESEGRPCGDNSIKSQNKNNFM